MENRDGRLYPPGDELTPMAGSTKKKMGVVERVPEEIRCPLYNPSPRSVLLGTNLPDITHPHNGTKVGRPLSSSC